MFLYQGIREKIKEDVSAGMDYCPHCRIFTRFFLGRHLRIQHLNYIPLKTWVLDYAEFCEKCRAAAPESAAAVMDALAAEFPVRSSPQLEEIYRRRIEMLLA